MGLHALGDSAWLFKASTSSPQKNLDLILRLRHLLQLHPIPEIIDIVSSFDTIAVHFNPTHGQEIFDHLTSLHLEDTPPHTPQNPKTITIPVVYHHDLEPLAHLTNLTPSEIIALHRDTEYTVAAIGFSPGFPYLQGLPPQLHLPRHPSPRKIPAGSIAIAADQAGIYPFASQGGWHILGHTSQTLFDPHRQHPSLLQPGDKVRFKEVKTLKKTTPPPPQPPHPSHIHIIHPGPLSSIQDHGRWSHQHLGLSPGGAADPLLATIANRLVGNPDEAALIECTMSGPLLKFTTPTLAAWVGWGSQTSGKPHTFHPGETLDLRSRISHLRGYIAIRGGIGVPEILGSRSTDIRAHLGGHLGRPLQPGDTLPIGTAPTTPISGKWHIAWPRPTGNIITLRYLPGIQANWFTPEAHRYLSGSFYEISPTSDRTGTRLTGAALRLHQPREMTSQPVTFGSVQIPPNGQPIILMSERQTIGGYPQIAHIISADLPTLARAWPGTKIHFQQITLEEARHAWHQLQRDLALLHIGLQLKLQEPP